MRQTNHGLERLEGRQLMTATVVGSPTVYPTIQSAVDAAPVGGTVRVGPGQYDELVTIGKTITVQGAFAGVDARSPVRGRGESVVDGQPVGGTATSRTTAFYVTGDDVTLDGFTVQGQTSGGQYGAGIVLAPGVFGTKVLDDVIQNNVAGLYLANASATDPAVIRHDVFASNNTPGTNNGRGIYTDGGVSGGLLTNVLIDANTFVNNVGDGTSGNPEAAVGLEAQTAGKQFNVTISNNVMAGNGKGLLVFNATNVAFTGNLVTGSTDGTSAAVRVEGNVSGLTVAHNAVLGGRGAAVRITNRFVGTNSAIAVNLNTFSGNLAGITVDAAGYVAGSAVDGRFNYFGPGQANSGAVTTSSLAVPPPLSPTFAADNGPAATIAADVLIGYYALAQRNLLLLALLMVPTAG